jgi:hypothetical protein
MQPAALSCLWSPRFSKPSDVRSFAPPSEDEMAAWLGAIVKGEELACNDDDDGSRRPTIDDDRDVVPAVKGTSPTTAMDKKEKIPTTTTEGRMMGNNTYVRTCIYMKIPSYSTNYIRT